MTGIKGSEPTNELRFVNRITSHATQTVSKILQQRWVVRSLVPYGNGEYHVFYEWRDVPVESGVQDD